MSKTDNHVKANEALERRVDQVTDLARRAGFRAAGWTEPRVIDVLADGTEVKTPPRKRFIQSGTGVRMTVGRKLTYFYITDAGQTTQLASFNTCDVHKIAQWLLEQNRQNRQP